MKIVINRCYGGFGISPKCMDRYYGLKGIKVYHFKDDFDADKSRYIPSDGNDGFITSFSVPNPNDFNTEELWGKYFIDSRSDDRTDPLLIQAIEEIGEQESSSRFAKLRVVEIPDGIDYYIDDYDGIETIHESHQSWG